MISNKKPIIEDEELQNKIGELCEMLSFVTNSEYDQHMLYFFASGGLIMSGVDDEISPEEYKQVLDVLSGFTMYPQDFLKYLNEELDVEDVFVKSVATLLEMNPSVKSLLFEYLINITLIDKDIKEIEITSLYEIGEKIFRFTKKEIAQIIVNCIQSRFFPDIYK